MCVAVCGWLCVWLCVCVAVCGYVCCVRGHDNRFVWEQQRTHDPVFRVDNAMRFEQFKEFVCRLGLLVFSVPPYDMPEASPGAKVDRFIQYLHLGDLKRVRCV